MFFPEKSVGRAAFNLAVCEDMVGVRDASLTQTYSFLLASWAGDTHEETDVLPIGDQEEKGK